jgi:hypothetical protein
VEATSHSVDTRVTHPASPQAVTHPVRRRLHQVAFRPVYYADAVEVAGLLLQSADPAAGWLSAGDNGVYTAVANQLGRSYKYLAPALAVGPALAAGGSKSDSSVANNVAVSFSENLLGSCKDENGADIIDSGSCVVPTATMYGTNPADGVVNAAALTHPADASVPAGFVAVSGVVTLRVGGTDGGALPCAVPGCTASLRMPLLQAPAPSQLYQCFQVVDGQIKLAAKVVATTASHAVEQQPGQVPTFTCSVKEAGSYLVGRYADPNRSDGVPQTVYSNLTNLVSGSQGVAHYRTQCSFISHPQCLESTQADQT